MECWIWNSLRYITMVKELGLVFSPSAIGKSGISMWSNYVVREYNKKKLKEERVKKLNKLNNYE